MKTVWQPKAIKQLKKLGNKDAQAKILKATDGLVQFPNVPRVIALTNHVHGYRIRVGNYRVLFNVQDVIEVISIEEIKKRDENTY